MASYNASRKGSMGFYPRVRAKKITPSIKAEGKEAKALSFLCYKAGMLQVMGKNAHKGSPSFGQEVVIPATVIECPNLKVFGIRAYGKAEIGSCALVDVLADNIDNTLTRKIVGNTKKKEGKEKKDKKTIADFEKILANIDYFTLLVHTQPKVAEFKKTPDVSEIDIGGTKEEQLNYAKEKLGKEITIEEVFKEGEFLDVKAVTKGKGFQGVVKRFGVKQHRPKAKKRRVVGSISPWTPSTVMFTVARPGQMGFHNRTEYNKKIIKISDNIKEVNPVSGFTGYGMVKGKFILIAGSVAGVSKRCIALRKSVRPAKTCGIQLQAVEKILAN